MSIKELILHSICHSLVGQTRNDPGSKVKFTLNKLLIAPEKNAESLECGKYLN